MSSLRSCISKEVLSSPEHEVWSEFRRGDLWWKAEPLIQVRH